MMWSRQKIKASISLTLILLMISAASYQYALSTVPLAGPYYLDLPFSDASYYVGLLDNGNAYMVDADTWESTWSSSNSTALINAAWANASLEMGTVFIRAGTYVVNGLIPQNNTVLCGEGYGTHLLLTPGATRPITTANENRWSIILAPTGTITENVTIRNIRFDGNRANSDAVQAGDRGVGCIDINGVFSHWRVNENIFQNHAMKAVLFAGNGSNLIVNDNYVENMAWDGITFEASSGYILRDAEACHNTIVRVGDNALTTFGSGLIEYVLFDSNIIYDMTTTDGSAEKPTGIRLQTGSRFVTATNNIIRDVLSGISTHSASLGNHTIIGNTIQLRDNTTAFIAQGLYSDQGAGGNLWSHNRIISPPTDNCRGIYNRADNETFTFNVMVDGGSGAFTGLTLYKGNYTKVFHNDFSETDTPITFSTTNNNEFRDNIGFITENGGSVAAGGAGTPHTIAHGLAGTPTSVNAIPQADAGDVFIDTVGAANFNINWDGGGNIAFYWWCEYKP